MTNPANAPGERPPRLERPPSDRYRPAATEASANRDRSLLDSVAVPIAMILGTAIVFVVLGGILAVTSGLVVAAAFFGWMTGRLVSPPARAASVAVAAVAIGLLGIWLFGRIEGGVLDPIAYLLEVEGPLTVVLSLLASGGLAAAASR